jgi:hypothetical protein
MRKWQWSVAAMGLAAASGWSCGSGGSREGIGGSTAGSAAASGGPALGATSGLRAATDGGATEVGAVETGSGSTATSGAPAMSGAIAGSTGISISSGHTSIASGSSAGSDMTSDDSGTVDSSGSTGASGVADGESPSGAGHHIKTVFLILMENSNWNNQNNNQQYIHLNPNAPYLNKTLVPENASCTNYFDNPKAVHPSEPNYIWLEAGDNLGFTNDDAPSATHVLTTPDHLTAYLDKAGVTWREYAEGIDGKTCPLGPVGRYAPKHVPFVFFGDVVGDPPDPKNAYCIAHIHTHADLQGDLMNDSVAAYNFITPDLCDDMHDACTGDAVAQGDTWLSGEIAMITGSRAYKSGGAIFVTWDESEGGEYPIGMVVLSPFAKTAGYQSPIKYYHSSMLRTVQEIFGVAPLLGDAQNQADLSDLFTAFP